MILENPDASSRLQFRDIAQEASIPRDAGDLKMGIYAGLRVLFPISNQRRYDLVLAEVLQFLALHQEEVQYSTEDAKFLVIKSTQDSDPVALPLLAANLRTVFFRIHSSSLPPSEVKQFGAVVWEVLNILLENYPSKLELAEENLDRCSPYYFSVSEYEALRRQLSCLASRKDESSVMQVEEMEDLWHVLFTTITRRDLKGTFLCLDLLNSTKHCPAFVFKKARPCDLRLLESVIEDSENLNSMQFPAMSEKVRNLAQSILDRATSEARDKSLERSTDSIKSMLSTTSYDLPSSLNVLMFQLNETTCIERVAFLLESLDASFDTSELIRLKWDQRLMSLIVKYCDGVFETEESEAVRFGRFQVALLSHVLKLSKNTEQYLQLMQMGLFWRLYEIVEEACLLCYQLIINKEDSSMMLDFIHKAFVLADLAINPAYYKNLQALSDSLYKVNSRLLSLAAPPALVEDMPLPVDSENLKQLCPELYECHQQVKGTLTKLEALIDYQLTHELKFQKLFKLV
mmetsp:Transcript_27288/g.49041  ORF Transcript_27288/g.49041 Transcript_27288/m.49041 type:complete len:516 (-) Transcript_27288:17-1564(-)